MYVFLAYLNTTNTVCKFFMLICGSFFIYMNGLDTVLHILGLKFIYYII